ncbi:MAG: hypothetical protein LH629_12930 [Ignavibacteria bacterium]|nr:hypothetical protein [Ignavibacteria bacterium]
MTYGNNPRPRISSGSINFEIQNFKYSYTDADGRKKTIKDGFQHTFGRNEVTKKLDKWTKELHVDRDDSFCKGFKEGVGYTVGASVAEHFLNNPPSHP